MQPNDPHATNPSATEVEGNAAPANEAEAMPDTQEPTTVLLDKSVITAYVSEEIANDAATAEELIEVMTADDAVDIDFMIEFLTSHELDPQRRINLFEYLKLQTPETLNSLWEAFKATYGPSVKQIELNQVVTQHIANVTASKSLVLRNESAQAELHRFGTMYAQLARQFRSDLTDSPMASFRVDNLTTYIQKLHSDITTLNSAILGMSEMLLTNAGSPDTADMAINIEQATRICAIVGYSAKGWANITVEATKTQAAMKKENDDLRNRLKAAQELITTNLASVEQERKRIENLTIAAGEYYINNHSGNYLATINDPQGDYFRVTPFNVRLVQNQEDGLVFDDLEAARLAFDAIKLWGKSNPKVKKMFADAGVNVNTLFISARTIVKVEG